MKFWKKVSEQAWFPYTVAICIGIAFYMLLSNISLFGNFFAGLWSILKPLLYALILAYLIDPIARFYEKKPFARISKANLRRNMSVILASLTVLIIVGGFAAAIIPSLITSVSKVFTLLSKAVKELDANKGHLLSSDLPFGLGETLSNISISETVLDKFSTTLSDNLSNIASTSVTIGSGFANFVIAFILAIYYMMGKEHLKTLWKRVFQMILKEKKYEVFHDFAKQADSILLMYIKGTLVEALIVGLANAIFMIIGRIPYVLLVSIIVGLTNIAPTFGPIVGAVVGALMLVLVNPWYAVAFLIFTVILQTIDGYIIKPRLFGNSLGVSPLLILIMIIVGGRLCGVIGILLAIPFAAIAQYVVESIWKSHKDKKETKKAISADDTDE